MEKNKIFLIVWVHFHYYTTAYIEILSSVYGFFDCDLSVAL